MKLYHSISTVCPQSGISHFIGKGLSPKNMSLNWTSTLQAYFSITFKKDY